MTGLFELGAFIGCLFLPSIAGHISSKGGLTVAIVVYVIGAAIQTASMNYGTLVGSV
ncbi:hypothetical protein BDV23DRAFT_158583 [Aspergillus alliaceus]|uniref:Major facilitator superfamily (MFS) profile domain-containing protein n=1 Tax=Petromyces alliaceus TaxID=209559 RepID=A0A5N7C3M5_PETAA|nr:hypothetical protein BDV23DRAFT_158583 [Aspergillus alliaceus]